MRIWSIFLAICTASALTGCEGELPRGGRQPDAHASALTAPERKPYFPPEAKGLVDIQATSAEARAALNLPSGSTVNFDTSDSRGIRAMTTPASGFPTAGASYLAISSGCAALATSPNNSSSTTCVLDGLDTRAGQDMVQVTADIPVPAGAKCWLVDWKFFSEEFPEFVGSSVNDTFLIEVGSSNISFNGPNVIAPNNVAFDANGQVISINTTGALGMSSAAAAGTTYDGATSTLNTQAPIASGTTSLRLIFSVFDVGDSVYDTTVFLDNFRFSGSPCGQPVTAPVVIPPPDLILTSPAEGQVFSPSSPAADATEANVVVSGDPRSPSTVTIYNGNTPITSFTAGAGSTTAGNYPWSRTITLPVGTHTLRVTATNQAGTSTQTRTVHVRPNAPTFLEEPASIINGAQGTVAWLLQTFPGARVDVTLQDPHNGNTEQALGTIEADSDGYAYFEMPRPADGTPLLRFYPRASGGQRGPAAQDQIAVDSQPPALSCQDPVVRDWDSSATSVSVEADDSSSYVPGNTLSYAWSVVAGNGSVTQVSGGPTLSQVYAPGSYQVSATVRDLAGNSATCSTSITLLRRGTVCQMPDVRAHGAPVQVSGLLTDATLGTSLGAPQHAQIRYEVNGVAVADLGSYLATIAPGTYSIRMIYAGDTYYQGCEDTGTLMVGVWSYTGSLGCGRLLHTATLMPDGQVLVVGGFNPSTQLYNPATGTWANTGNTITTHRYHTATLLNDGRLLVAGGGRHPRTGLNAEVYSSLTGTWSAAGNMLVQRSRHTATLLPDGRVLVTGGSDSSDTALASTEVYDPNTETWSFSGSMAMARRHHTATLLPDGRVLVAGGEHSGQRLASAEVYDPGTGTWTTISSMNVARRYHAATLLPNGLVLVTGGGTDGQLATSAELYDPATGTWTSTASMGSPRRYHTATLLPDGRVLVTGGYDNFTGILTTAELYDPATGAWSSTGSMNEERYWHTATLLSNGRVLVVGGFSNGDQSSAELL